MHCPTCKLPLLTVEIQGIELDYCAQDHGCWFDEGEIEALLQSLVPVVLPTGEGPKGARRCPRCRARMNIHQPCDGLELDLCPHGDGIWFDAIGLGTLIAELQSQQVSRELAHLDRVLSLLATKLGGSP